MTRHRLAIVAMTLFIPALCHGQAASVITRDDVPLEEYLRMLEVIAPSARGGAEAYMASFRRKCGRPLRTIELRRLVADERGDPVLIQMIQATHYRDPAALQQLDARVACPRG